MEQNNIEILNKKRRNLSTLIGEWINRNKSPKDIKSKVQEYYDITTQLSHLGVNVDIRTKYLIPEYWDTHTVDDYKKDKETGNLIIKQPNKNTKVVEKIVEKVVEKVKYVKEYNYYILNIVWSKTETNKVTPMMVDEYITNYLEYIGVKKTSDDFSEFWDRIEYNFKYDFRGSQETLNIIIDSIKFLAKKNNMDLEIYFKINKNKK